MNTIGKLYVFEGPDDVGKTTLAKAIAAKLDSPQEKYSYFAFPGNAHGTVGKLVYDLHHDSKSFNISQISATCLQILHIGAHIDAIENKLRPFLQNGTNVILDRFWWSTKAYGATTYANMSAIEHAINAEIATWGTIFPSIIFYIERKMSTKNSAIALEYEKILKQNDRNTVRILNEEIHTSISTISHHIRQSKQCIS